MKHVWNLAFKSLKTHDRECWCHCKCVSQREKWSFRAISNHISLEQSHQGAALLQRSFEAVLPALDVSKDLRKILFNNITVAKTVFAKCDSLLGFQKKNKRDYWKFGLGGALAAFGALFLSGWNSRTSACQPGLPVGCWLCRHDPNQLHRNQNVACMQQTSMTQQARLVFLFAHLGILSQQANSPPSVAKPLKQSVLKPQTAQQRVHPDNLWILCCIEHEIRKSHNLSRAISMAPCSGPLNCLLYMCFV